MRAERVREEEGEARRNKICKRKGDCISLTRVIHCDVALVLEYLLVYIPHPVIRPPHRW